MATQAGFVNFLHQVYTGNVHNFGEGVKAYAVGFVSGAAGGLASKLASNVYGAVWGGIVGGGAGNKWNEGKS